MNPIPEVTTAEKVQKKSGYQSLQPVVRPSYWGVDLDLSRRPGVPMMREPQPWPNTRYPPERQQGEPASPMHGRPNKELPPVFGTSTPLKGLSGVVRKLAYSLPDHKPSHWLLMLLGDRVDLWETRARRYLPVVVPLAALAFIGRSLLTETPHKPFRPAAVR
jgi:hypothetical protein